MKLKSAEVESLEKEMLASIAKLKELGAGEIIIFANYQVKDGGRTYSAVRDGSGYTIAGTLGRWLADFNSGVLDEYAEIEEGTEATSDEDEGPDLFDADGNLK